MIINSTEALAKYQKAAQLSTKILSALRQAIKPGVTSLELDQLADQLCQKHKVKPVFKGVPGTKSVYQHATCISVNDVVVHGIPDSRPLRIGDLVKVDFGIIYQGLITDHCFTVAVQKFTSTQDEKLVKTAQKAIQKAAHLAVKGKTTGDLGHAIQSTVEKAGFNVVREYVGHGVGRRLHEEPQLPAFGQPKTGMPLLPGMVLCVEAQVVAGDQTIFVTDDGWTVKTKDGNKAAMFEYMLIVGQNKPIFLTPTLDWPIVSG